MKVFYSYLYPCLLLFLMAGALFGQGGTHVAGAPKAGQQELIPSQYVFFQGDTLQGMDLNSLFNDLGRFHTLSHLSEPEKKAYMYGRQREFVRVKYHLPGRAFVDPLLSPDQNE